MLDGVLYVVAEGSNELNMLGKDAVAANGEAEVGRVEEKVGIRVKGVEEGIAEVGPRSGRIVALSYGRVVGRYYSAGGVLQHRLGEHFVVNFEEFFGPFAFEGCEEGAAFFFHASVASPKNCSEKMIFEGCVMVEYFWDVLPSAFEDFAHATEVSFVDKIDTLESISKLEMARIVLIPDDREL